MDWWLGTDQKRELARFAQEETQWWQRWRCGRRWQGFALPLGMWLLFSWSKGEGASAKDEATVIWCPAQTVLHMLRSSPVWDLLLLQLAPSLSASSCLWTLPTPCSSSAKWQRCAEIHSLWLMANTQTFCKLIIKLLVAWNQPWWQYLHLGNWQMRAFFFFSLSCGGLVNQCTTERGLGWIKFAQNTFRFSIHLYVRFMS